MPLQLSTPRLLLSPVALEDEPHYVRLYGDPVVMCYLGAGVRAPEASAAAVAAMVKHWQEQGFGYYTIRDREGRFLGRCGLRRVADVGEVELGYTLLEEFWGQGFATEAARAVLQHGFETVGLERIIAVADPDNRRSLRVMEKLGMQLEKREPFQGFPAVWYVRARQATG